MYEKAITDLIEMMDNRITSIQLNTDDPYLWTITVTVRLPARREMRDGLKRRIESALYYELPSGVSVNVVVLGDVR